MAEPIIIVETPRDAFQGLPVFIPTAEKIRHIQLLVEAGYKHIDLGSFVPPKVVPQMADTAEVVAAFKNNAGFEHIAIVLNRQGMERAFDAGGLDALGFPFSLSQQFQRQNTHASQTQTWPVIASLIEEIENHDMSFILYLSMAFGNRYGEPWNEEALFAFIRSLCGMGVRHISLSDTVAVATPEQVRRVFARARVGQPDITFSAHFHSRSEHWFDCVQAALESGCRRFDAASGGLGGCPFAHDQLVANIPSEKLVERLEKLGYHTGVDTQKALRCAEFARDLQKKYGTLAHS
jgi:hydroxymethylglutaryl-CoA lyase